MIKFDYNIDMRVINQNMKYFKKHELFIKELVNLICRNNNLFSQRYKDKDYFITEDDYFFIRLKHNKNIYLYYLDSYLWRNSLKQVNNFYQTYKYVRFLKG